MKMAVDSACCVWTDGDFDCFAGDEEDNCLAEDVMKIEHEYFRNPKHYTLFSGGARGSDQHWQKLGAKFGVKVKAFSFERHGGKNGCRVVLSPNELKEADEYLYVANATLKRHFPTGKSFIDNLLRRNWFQVKETAEVFAIGKISATRRTVEGGTGWTVQMAIDRKKPVHVFDISKNVWHRFDYDKRKFVIHTTPKLSLESTGIGTRSLPEAGKKAIEDVFKLTFESGHLRKDSKAVTDYKCGMTR